MSLVRKSGERFEYYELRETRTNAQCRCPLRSFDFTGRVATGWVISSTRVTQKRSPVMAGGGISSTVSTCALSRAISAGLKQTGIPLQDIPCKREVSCVSLLCTRLPLGGALSAGGKADINPCDKIFRIEPRHVVWPVGDFTEHAPGPHPCMHALF
jgi:hypothetical protein